MPLCEAVSSTTPQQHFLIFKNYVNRRRNLHIINYINIRSFWVLVNILIICNFFTKGYLDINQQLKSSIKNKNYYLVIKFDNITSSKNRMDKKKKKILIIGGAIEGAILVFALVLSIIVWSTTHTVEQAAANGMTLADFNEFKNGKFIAFFQNEPIYFFIIICVPIFIIVALDLVYLAIEASKRESNLSDEQMEAIKKKAEAEVREEIMKEMLEQEQQKEEPKEQGFI